MCVTLHQLTGYCEFYRPVAMKKKHYHTTCPHIALKWSNFVLLEFFVWIKCFWDEILQMMKRKHQLFANLDWKIVMYMLKICSKLFVFSAAESKQYWLSCFNSTLWITLFVSMLKKACFPEAILGISLELSSFKHILHVLHWYLKHDSIPPHWVYIQTRVADKANNLQLPREAVWKLMLTWSFIFLCPFVSLFPTKIIASSLQQCCFSISVI